MNLSNLKVRPAVPEDAPRVCEVHRRSIEVLGPRVYSQEVVAGWRFGLSPEVHQRAMNEQEDMFVAEVDGVIVGFGSIIIGDSEIRAVYADPAFIRQGIGSRILEQLESHARKAGLRELNLASSLLAVEFYESHGYANDGPFAHHLKRSGVDISCVRMRKDIFQEECGGCRTDNTQQGEGSNADSATLHRHTSS